MPTSGHHHASKLIFQKKFKNDSGWVSITAVSMSSISVSLQTFLCHCKNHLLALGQLLLYYGNFNFGAALISPPNIIHQESFGINHKEVYQLKNFLTQIVVLVNIDW
jgi:hypothetical protein